MLIEVVETKYGGSWDERVWRCKLDDAGRSPLSWADSLPKAGEFTVRTRSKGRVKIKRPPKERLQDNQRRIMFIYEIRMSRVYTYSKKTKTLPVKGVVSSQKCNNKYPRTFSLVRPSKTPACVAWSTSIREKGNAKTRQCNTAIRMYKAQ